ncbi:MAG: hypothetical protein QXP98_08135 [Thermoproteus sp.]
MKFGTAGYVISMDGKHWAARLDCIEADVYIVGLNMPVSMRFYKINARVKTRAYFAPAGGYGKVMSSLADRYRALPWVLYNIKPSDNCRRRDKGEVSTGGGK